MPQWRRKAIAEQARVARSTVLAMEHNLIRYGQVTVPHRQKLGRPNKLNIADEETLVEWKEKGDAISEKCSISSKMERNKEVVAQSVASLLKRREWNRKRL